jgi:hypothetical protein
MDNTGESHGAARELLDNGEQWISRLGTARINEDWTLIV